VLRTCRIEATRLNCCKYLSVVLGTKTGECGCLVSAYIFELDYWPNPFIDSPTERFYMAITN